MDKEKLAKNLTAHGFTPHFFATKEEAADFLLASVQNTTVGIGGSVTIDQMDVYDRLCEKNEVFWHWKKADPDTRTKAALAHVYLSSANGISETGEIVNIDGRGNRVIGTLCGPEIVYILAGRNKVAPTLDAALDRARNIAAPLNARRLNRKTPCAVGEPKCHDCSSPDRICNGFTVISHRMTGMSEYHIVLIDEELGY